MANYVVYFSYQKRGTFMKPETQKELKALIAKTTHENAQQIAQKMKQVLASDGTVSKDEQNAILMRFVKEYVKADELQTVVNDYITLVKFVCKRLAIEHASALQAVVETGAVRVFVVHDGGRTELDFDRYVTSEVPHALQILSEIESMQRGGVSLKAVADALNEYGKGKPKQAKPTTTLSPKAERMAKNLVAFGKFYIEENEVENAKALVAKYDDGILDLYVKTASDEEFVDLEELVGDDEKRHRMLNEIFDDDLTPADIKAAIKAVNKYSL